MNPEDILLRMVSEWLHRSTLGMILNGGELLPAMFSRGTACPCIARSAWLLNTGLSPPAFFPVNQYKTSVRKTIHTVLLVKGIFETQSYSRGFIMERKLQAWTQLECKRKPQRRAWWFKTRNTDRSLLITTENKSFWDFGYVVYSELFL